MFWKSPKKQAKNNDLKIYDEQAENEREVVHSALHRRPPPLAPPPAHTHIHTPSKTAPLSVFRSMVYLNGNVIIYNMFLLIFVDFKPNFLNQVY